MEKTNIEDVKKALQESEGNEEIETSEEIESPENSEETEETSASEEAKEPHIPKYRLDEVISQREELKREREKLSQQLTEKENELNEIKEMSGEEVAEALEVRNEVKALKNSLAYLQDKIELESFLASNPKAKSLSSSLLKLKSAYPSRSYASLYKEIFEPFEKKEKINVETGRGSATQVFETGEMSPEKFRGLSLAEQEKYLKKLGL